MLSVKNITKCFTLHQQGGTQIKALDAVSFRVKKGECLALQGPSGSGKSTLMRLLYGNYKAQTGTVAIVLPSGQLLNLVTASPRQIIKVRQYTIGYVSQFLRLIPRVTCLSVVMEPLLQRGVSDEDAEGRAAALLARLNIPSNLWTLAPSTFSGGEQQRVNIARGFIASYPLLLLDEPTASLDAENREVVIKLMLEAKTAGSSLVGIFHDPQVRDAVADQVLTLS